MADLAGKFGDWMGGPIQAFTKAGVNPMAAVTQNDWELTKTFSYYRNNPSKLNTLGLKSNMLMRYLSGVGAQGMQFPEGIGNQLLTDIREQDTKFKDPTYRQEVLDSANTPKYIKQGLLQGRIPVYYGGMSDAPAPIKSQLPIDVGQRGQLSKSIGSFWAQPTPGGGFISYSNFLRIYSCCCRSISLIVSGRPATFPGAPGTLMPPCIRIEGLTRPLKEFIFKCL